jgi:L-histidine N-alpha-methyltransferase
VSQALLAQDATAAEQRTAFRADALAGLTAPRKTLPCKWLYDAEGARLFEAITRQPEYYPTRTEVKILTEQAPAIAAAVDPGATVVEFGPGDGGKAVLLLSRLCAAAAYVPVEIAPEWLDAVATRVTAEVPGLPVLPVVADFTRPFALPPGVPRGRRLGFFPGSTVGNFELTEAADLLRRFRSALGSGARLLLGADLVKDRAVLEAAYDDAAGVTAAFDLNLLHRLNRELGADFDVAAFRHRALWNAEAERVEMHLEATRAQRVRLAGREIRFGAGETIHTESSHKYRPERFEALADAAGWRKLEMWTDPRRLFSVWLLEAR